MTSYFTGVPDEIILEIFWYLNPSDFILIKAVSQRWKRILTSFHLEYLPLRVGLSFTTVYPGIENHLDLFYCLGRSIKLNHLPGVAYFTKRVTRENLDVGEFATLFDLWQIHHHPRIFYILLKKFLLIYRQHYHSCLFLNLDQLPSLEGFPKPATGRGSIPRFPFFDPPPEELIDSKHNYLRAGRKLWVIGRNSHFNKERRNYSLEINTMIEKLP